MAVVRFPMVFIGFGGAFGLTLEDENVEEPEGTANESEPYTLTRPVFELSQKKHCELVNE
jgi:hypothetical protein